VPIVSADSIHARRKFALDSAIRILILKCAEGRARPIDKSLKKRGYYNFQLGNTSYSPRPIPQISADTRSWKFNLFLRLRKDVPDKSICPLLENPLGSTYPQTYSINEPVFAETYSTTTAHKKLKNFTAETPCVHKPEIIEHWLLFILIENGQNSWLPHLFSALSLAA